MFTKREDKIENGLSTNDGDSQTISLTKTLGATADRVAKYHKFDQEKDCDFMFHMTEGVIEISSGEWDASAIVKNAFNIMAVIPGVDGIFPSSTKLKPWSRAMRKCLQEMQTVLGTKKAPDPERYVAQDRYRQSACV